MVTANDSRVAERPVSPLPVGVLYLDRRGLVRYANAAARTALGNIRTVAETPPFLQVIDHCLQSPERGCTSYLFEKGPRCYKIIARFIGDEIVIILADITHEKEVERAKTEFVALASHQLRTPLSVMKWMLERIDGRRLSRGTHPPEVRRALSRIAASNEQMIALVNDLLSVARLEAGKAIPSPVAVDLRLITTHVFGEFSVKIKEKRLAVRTPAAFAPLKVFVDTKFLHEILTNLVSNAVKYTPARGQVRVRFAPHGQKNIDWIIEDSGVSVPPKERHQIFEKFFRGENVAGTEIEGTGLGLYVAQTMAKASGGVITYRPGKERGASLCSGCRVLARPVDTIVFHSDFRAIVALEPICLQHAARNRPRY